MCVYGRLLPKVGSRLCNYGNWGGGVESLRYPLLHCTLPFVAVGVSYTFSACIRHCISWGTMHRVPVTSNKARRSVAKSFWYTYTR